MPSTSCWPGCWDGKSPTRTPSRRKRTAARPGGPNRWSSRRATALASPNAAAIAQENEAAYYPRLYNEYLNALRNLGKPSEGLSVPAFMAKLRLAEAGLKQKWSCRMVRFQLVSRGDDVVFRAVRVD